MSSTSMIGFVWVSLSIYPLNFEMKFPAKLQVCYYAVRMTFSFASNRVWRRF